MTTATATRPEVLRSPNVDLAKEHGAIVQYVLHAAQARDSVLISSIMTAAREEMWHMDWLTEAIRERGGKASINRQEPVFTSEGLIRSLEADVEAENDALDHYAKTLELIGDSDEQLTRLIERIMDDERHHRTSFTRMGALVGSKGEEAFRASPEMSPTDAATAAPMVELEYEGLLQYLQNKYGVEDKEESETYFELAVNEMRHLRWVGTCMMGLGVPQPPPAPTDRVERVDGSEAALRRADDYERKASEMIGRIRAAVAGETIAAEMRRIDYQHGYHRFQLEHWGETEGGA